jgi:hypothetical protein
MIVIIGLVVVIVAGWLLMSFVDDLNPFFFFPTLFAGISLFGCLLFFPIAYYDTKENIASFNATKKTVEVARSHGNILENAALQTKIIECNNWLAGSVYYKSTIWGLWIPSEVLSLRPIE